jgi:hypothetical protein
MRQTFITNTPKRRLATSPDNADIVHKKATPNEINSPI